MSYDGLNYSLPKPTAPTGIKSSVLPTGLKIEWNASPAVNAFDRSRCYDVYIYDSNDTLVKFVSTGVTYYVFEDLTAGTYKYRVAAVSDNYNTNYISAFTFSDYYYVDVENIYTVKYDANGGTGAPDSQVKKANETLRLSSKAPTRDGYIFQCWSTDKNADIDNLTYIDTYYLLSDLYKNNADLILYAVWSCNHIYDNGCDTTCNRCGKTRTTTHTVVTDSAKAATCTETGLTEGSHCSVCKAVIKAQTTTAALNHDFSVFVETIAPTTEAQGYTTYKCSRCTATENRDFVDPIEVEPDDPTAPRIEVSTVTARAGDTVTVDVVIANNPGISSFTLNIDYDETVMTLDDVSCNTAEMGGQFICIKKAVWIADKNSTFNGTVMTLTFTINGEVAEGDYPVSVSYKAGDICNYDEEDVDFALKAGKITVIDYIPGDINGDGVVNNKDLTRLLKYISGDGVEVVKAALDVNGDGSVNNKDLTRLLKYISGADVEIY